MQLSCNIIKKGAIQIDDKYKLNAPDIERPKSNSDSQAQAHGSDEYKHKDEYIKKSQQIIDGAAREGKNIIEKAKKEAEKIKKDSYDDGIKKGHEEGYQKGYEEGLKSGFDETKDVRDQAQNVLDEAHRASREYIKNQKDEIVNLAISIAEKIIGYEADTKDEAIENIVKKSIESVIYKKSIKIWVNPLDYATLDCRMNEILEQTNDEAIVTLLKDEAIKRGGCKIETEVSSVDATIDTQLTKIKEALMGDSI